mgnify:CR=1 FL=1
MYKTLQDFVGNTPLVRLMRIPGAESERRGNVILAKLEGNNPAGSVKDRPALSMIVEAERRGEIRPGDTLIEPTSGNTGIALAMVAAMRGFRMVLIMPDNLSIERRQAMTAYGAELILTPKAGGMEGARDLAEQILKTTGNITTVIDNLEKHELVQRVREVKDRRYFQVILTPEGEKLIRKIFPSHVKRVQQVMDLLTPEEQETLRVLCLKLEQSIEGK